MADLFIDRMAKQLILDYIRSYDGFSWTNENITRTDKASLKALAQTLFWNVPAVEVYDIIDEACYDASHEQEWYARVETMKVKEEPKKEVVRVRGSKRKLIDANLKISEVAKKYGLKVKRNKVICPFHADSDPSLSLSDEKNVFYCFGCGAKGDIIEFIRRMEELGYAQSK